MSETNLLVTAPPVVGENGAKPRGDKAAEALAVGEEFEALFLAQMLAPMFAGLEGDTTFGGGPTADVYRSLLVREYGKILSRNGGVGIAEAVQREILKVQEVE